MTEPISLSGPPETLDAMPVSPTGYEPTRWTPYSYGLMAGVVAAAAGTIWADRIDNTTMFSVAFLFVLVLMWALVVTLGLGARAANSGTVWVVAKKARHGK